MSLKIGCGGLVAIRLLTLCELTLSAMVLPRPPSSPNDIPRETIHGNTDGKFRNDKTLYSLVSFNTNVEKPNTDGYRLLEIELRGADEVDETNLRGLVRAMLSGEEDDDEEEEEEEEEERHPDVINERQAYEKPKVIPHSILGVRDIGPSPNYRIHSRYPTIHHHHHHHHHHDKNDHLLRPLNDRVPDEKLYYLKNTRPKVDVNVRGNNGSFTGVVSKTINDQSWIVRPPSESAIGHDRNTKSLLDKKIRRPKKYQPPVSSRENFTINNNEDHSSSGPSYATGEYEPRPNDNDETTSTTENMAVTLSELPKQIPPPPSRILPRPIHLVAQTTPVQKYALRRTDILPGYSYAEAS